MLTPSGATLATVIAAILLGGTVFAAVHHAEVVAHRIGEPFGTLVLAVAVTVIEVALIVSVMISGGAAKAALARDTVFSAIMIVCTGIVGLCLLLGGIRHREQDFHLQGATSAMGVLAALSVLSLVLPNYTSSQPGPAWSQPQLAFSGFAALVLYGMFVFVQTIRHRDYFLPVDDTAGDETSHAKPPSKRQTWESGVLLMACLVAVVGLAKKLSPVIEEAVVSAGAPAALVGIVIAALVLLPEGLAAVRAAQANRLQTSLNLALGSALASIGLTIPVVAAIFIVTGQPLILGLEAKETVLLALTLLVSTISLSTGRTTILQGTVHLMIFAAFLFLSVVP
ncbi:calcium:proton antiporter [Uliginosibacterium sp. sgz301328]|uniref:calcium:proton antiporter n=1 Tax=Uliginosibacterium sp. sgz301328 TaxID=3243764 RepID=UPI00359E3D83